MEKMNEIRRKSMEKEQEQDDHARSQEKGEPGEKRRTKPETPADLKCKDKAAAAHKIKIVTTKGDYADSASGTNKDKPRLARQYTNI